MEHTLACNSHSQGNQLAGLGLFPFLAVMIFALFLHLHITSHLLGAQQMLFKNNNNKFE